MKRHGNIYSNIYDFSNLLKAHRRARRNKRFKSDVVRFSQNVEEQVIDLQNQLIYGTYQVGNYYEFEVYEPKQRTIRALPFKDRVVQHALCNILTPLLENSMIYDSYACRKGKGAQRGMLRAKQFIRREGPGGWIVKADVRKFFDSIDHEVLRRILSRKIKDRKALWLCYKFIGNNERGIPIGNLTSQFFANVYMDQLDHHVKDELGEKKYVRYMDDFIVVCGSKEQALAMKEHLEVWLKENLHLELNAKTQIFPQGQGVNFLGYRVWWSGIKIRHTTVRRIKRKIKVFLRRRVAHKAAVMDIVPTLMSWLGLAKWGNSKTITARILRLLNGGVP